MVAKPWMLTVCIGGICAGSPVHFAYAISFCHYLFMEHPLSRKKDVFTWKLKVFCCLIWYSVYCKCPKPQAQAEQRMVSNTVKQNYLLSSTRWNELVHLIMTGSVTWSLSHNWAKELTAWQVNWSSLCFSFVFWNRK